MRSGLFIIIVLLSGACAGLIHGGLNLVIIEPYLDEAIQREAGALLDGDLILEYESYRNWQKSGQVIAGMILGISTGSLFGIVYYISRRSLPGNHEIKKALVLAGLMWFVLFMVPFLKYPANLPDGTGAENVAFRGAIYLIFVAASGLAALGFYRISRFLVGRKKLAAAAGYGAAMAFIALIMPAAEPADGGAEWFRAASVAGVGVFWIADALILGALWRRFLPDARVLGGQGR